MDDHWIGPMPVELFLQDLMGSSDGQFVLGSPNHLQDNFQSIKSPEEYPSDKDYAKAVASVIQAVTSELSPAFSIVLDRERKNVEHGSDYSTVTDAFVYNSGLDMQISPTRWDKVDLGLEFRNSSSLCGFKDVKDDSLDEWVVQTESSCAYLDRLASCAAWTFNTQYRKHLFSFAPGLDGVRFFKWERTYSIVSCAFDFSTEGKYLIEFLYRFYTMTDSGRGMDDTVILATDKETSLAEPLLRPWIYRKCRPTFVKIRVPDGGSEREVIAGPAIATPKGIPGRATLDLPVYDMKTGNLGFLKDTWRDVSLPHELKMLKTLNDADITTSHKYIDEDWNLGAYPPVFRIHEQQRILTEEVGRPLSHFKSSKQLTRIVYEAFLAHEDAYTICKILHRDVSSGNILIIYDGKASKDNHDGGRRGMLNDLDKAAPQAKPTGTWQFMSTRLLADGMQKHLLQDDFESFIWRDFSMPPDTDLESELFLISPRPCMPPIDPEMVVLRDHKALGAFWRAALSKDGWPSDDGAEDQLAAEGSTKRPRQDDAQLAQKRQKSGNSTPAVAA
ncbi:hypothetical protein EV421DRAFT_1947486 [Armillaria borealis]|uniref:Fungal-type protein kinase domain-containing protein n=1 Tax=Armillaria borealis TaxID=47425 RepID=A0AA39ISH5_9AGAR|nr:hypothetical protein EV421DRAFT_1947486 [Armillaria borealis]